MLMPSLKDLGRRPTLLELEEQAKQDPYDFANFCIDKLGFGPWVKVHLHPGVPLGEQYPEDQEDIKAMIECIESVLVQINN